MTPSVETRNEADSFGVLTNREQQVADLASRGHSNKFIAHSLDLAEGTVKVHLHAVFQKLDVRNRVELIIKFSNR
jgi:two-component system, NarL family, nitrate/nitrite response regulator NarL